MIDTTLCKLILLYAFDKMEVPLDENLVISMCSHDNNWMSFMDCKDMLAQLVEAGFIYRNASGGSKFIYNITPEGRMCLANFYTRIPTTMRENISAYVKKNRIAIKKKQEFFSDYFKNGDGTYTVVLRIEQPSAQPLLELKMTVEGRNNARYIYSNWEEKAAQIYAMLCDNLLE